METLSECSEEDELVYGGECDDGSVSGEPSQGVERK